MANLREQVDMTKPKRIHGNDAARFDSRVDFCGPIPPGFETPCWLWLGAPSSNGYASFDTGTKKDRRRTGVHRWNYTRLVGPIPEGHQVDHLCRVRLCVNPDHLEAVPARVNNARSDSPTALNARKTHCIAGHELAGTNLMPNRFNQRLCRACHNERQRTSRAAERRAIQSPSSLRAGI